MITRSGPRRRVGRRVPAAARLALAAVAGGVLFGCLASRAGAPAAERSASRGSQSAPEVTGAPLAPHASSVSPVPDDVAPDDVAPATPVAPAVSTHSARARVERLLAELARSQRFALGHQDTTAYGVGWSGDADRSDVKSVCGAHAAVRGWDVFGIERGAAENGDGVDFTHMRELVIDAYRRGAINTISWHAGNPVSGGNAWDRRRAVRQILPGRPLHGVYRGYLERVASFLETLRGDSGELIPIIFRPFHEHTGSWFWWGGSNTTSADFVALWRFTVDYLRRERGLDNLLFAYSPNGGDVYREADYLYRYPGDDYVDVFGVDQYYRGNPRELLRVVEVAVEAAEAHGKIPALTEFGARDGLNAPGVDDRWILDDFLRPLERSAVGSRIAYALAWRNASAAHCFLPYPGHAGAAAFSAVCDDDRVVLEDDLARIDAESSQAEPSRAD